MQFLGRAFTRPSASYSSSLGRWSQLRGSRRVHDSAKEGFTAGSSEAYERGRPEYTDESLEQIKNILCGVHAANALPSPSTYKIVELGAGTGKFTQSFSRYFQTHCPTLSIDFLATEPSDGFRQRLADKHLPGITVSPGTSTSIPVEADNSVDMVIVAQAFHWMATFDTLQEIHRVLKPQGRLVLIWNNYDFTQADWLRRIDEEILQPAYDVDSTPRQQSEAWRNCFFFQPSATTPAASSATPAASASSSSVQAMFSPLHSHYLSYVHRGNASLLSDRVASTSVIVKQSPAHYERSLQRLAEIVQTHPQLAQARETGQFEIPYVTQVTWTYKK